MKCIVAPRASAIIYNLLLSRPDPRPFLLPANICPIVPITFLKAGREFTFIDISPSTLNMNQTIALEHVRNGNVAGILYAHTYGEPSSPGDFFNEVKKVNSAVLLIDDRCLCIPETTAPNTSFADVVLYSTGYAKVVDLSTGGYAFLQEGISYHEVSQEFRAEDLRNLEGAYKSSVAARQPFHYSDSAWLETGPCTLRWERYRNRIEKALPDLLRHRQEINQVYSTCLPSEIRLPKEMQLWRFQIWVPNPSHILKAIFAEKLFASAHYASLAGIMTPGFCPAAEDLASHIINLFNDYHYTVNMAQRTCEIIRGLL